MIDDRATLLPWQSAYARFFGSGPAMGELPGGGLSIRFPWNDDPFGLAKIMVGRIEVFERRPAMLSHLRAIGFDWDKGGYLVQAPSPSSFRGQLANVGLSESGFEPRLSAQGAPDLLLGEWFGAMCDGVVAINVGTQAFYDKHIPANHEEPYATRKGSGLSPKDVTKHFMYVQHDMTKHAILLHLVPKVAIRAFGDRIRQAFPELYPKWVADPAFMPHVASPITRFYENDLVIYCDRVYELTRSPEDFAKVFLSEPNYVQLLAELEGKVALSLDEKTSQSLKMGYRPPPYRLSPA